MIDHDWIRTELSGLYGYNVIKEMDGIIRYYEYYEGKGQDWIVDEVDGYLPAKVITNFAKKLINDESRFMVGRPPEITLTMLDDADPGATDKLNAWLRSVLDANSWRKRLLHGARDAFIGKRVAIKLSGTKGQNPTIRFAPSLEFVYDVDEDDLDRLKKIIFFWSITSETVTDRAQQRVWRQKYWMESGKCWMGEGLYDGYGRPVEVRHERTDTGLTFVPAYVVVNGGLSGDLSGESDLAELISNQDAYNRMRSDDIDALKYNMFPQKVFTDASQAAMDKVIIAPNAAIDLQTDPSANGRQASATVLESHFNYDERLQHALDQAKNNMHELLSVPNVGPDQLKNWATSGKTMKALYWSLICRCEEKWADGWDDALRWTVNSLIAMARAYGEPLPEIDYAVKIDHLYPLIDDEEEERERDLAEVDRQVRSRRGFIAKWQQGADPDAEMEQIAQEQALYQDAYTGAINTELRGM